jgi:hypothetical protein
MAYDYVTVNMSVASLDGSTGEIGSLHFEVDDFVLDMNTGAIIVVPPVHLEGNGGFTGNAVSLPFLAMDGAGISHNWHWVLVAQVNGRLTGLPHRKFTINLVNGATQNFKDLALASTIVA